MSFLLLNNLSLLFKALNFKSVIYIFLLNSLVDFNIISCNQQQNRIICSEISTNYNLMLLGGLLSIGIIDYIIYTYYNLNNGPFKSFMSSSLTSPPRVIRLSKLFSYLNNLNFNKNSNFNV